MEENTFLEIKMPKDKTEMRYFMITYWIIMSTCIFSLLIFAPFILQGYVIYILFLVPSIIFIWFHYKHRLVATMLMYYRKLDSK